MSFYVNHGMTKIDQFIAQQFLDCDNIKKYYIHEDWTAYKHHLFNYDDEKCDSLYQKAQYDIQLDILAMLPYCVDYMEEFNDEKSLLLHIKYGEYYKIFCIYALSVGDDIVNQYQDFIDDIKNDTTIRNIAISKLRRNKIVNNGFLLNQSIRNCGMFD